MICPQGVFEEALKGGVSNLSFGELSGNLGEAAGAGAGAGAGAARQGRAGQGSAVQAVRFPA